MIISFLSEFLTLASTQNFGTTAERHYISISTLIRHMHALEEHFGATLIGRHGNKSILTDAGKDLVVYAQTIVAAENDYRQKIAAFQDQPHLNASITTDVSLSFYGITDLIERFQCEHNINRIDIRLASDQQIKAELLDETMDFAIVWHLDKLPYHLTAMPLKKAELSVLLPASHPLAKKSSIHLSDLNGEPLLLLDNASAFYSNAIQLCREAGFSPTIRATALRGRSIEDLVAVGFGIGLLPMDPSTVVREDVIRMPISPRYEIALDIVYNSTIEPRNCVSTLMQYLCSAASSSGDTART